MFAKKVKGKTEKNRTINVIFICDENYALPTGVAIHTLFKQRDLKRHYAVFVLANGISADKARAICSIKEEGFTVSILDAEKVASYDSFDRMKDASHVSPAALYKFDIPNVFPHLKKALYIDGDVIIRSSLAELYDTDISEVYAAVCKDMGAESWPSHYNARLGISHGAYFNSGVMLLNLEMLRSDAIPAKLLHYKIYRKNDYMDQDAFNVIFAEKVKYFSFLYNMAVSCFYAVQKNELCEFYELGDMSKKELYNAAKILHLSSKEKPWLYNDVTASDEWLYEFISSPMSKFELHRTRYSGKFIDSSQEIDKASLWEIKRIQKEEDISVSVITPVYNSREHLPLAIESLMCQSLKNAEYIFVDDGSTDDSYSILEKYARLDGRIRIYKQRNLYAGAARNNGISHSEGEYITFLDSDDIMLPTALWDFVRSADKNNADIVISSASHFKNTPAHRENAAWCLRDGFIMQENGISLKNHAKYIFQITAGAPWGKLFRSSLIKDKNISFPSVPRAEDTYFVYLALILADSISVLRKDTVLYRNDTESSSLENTKDLHPLAQMRVKEMLHERLCKEGVYETVKQSFINNIINTLAYHFRTFKGPKAFSALYDEFKYRTIPTYGIDMNDAAYFYVKGEYDYMKRIYDSSDCLSYFHSIAAVYKDQADRHWRALMSKKNEQSDVKLPLSDVPDREAYLFFTSEVFAIRRSWSYRIGRFITLIPRKIRAFYRYSKREGFTRALYRAYGIILGKRGGRV